MSIHTELKEHQEGVAVDVKFPDGWRKGWHVVGTCARSDIPYGVTVVDDTGRVLPACHPDCVRATE